MGKATQVDGDNNTTSPETDPAKLLEAALLQMDGIIAEAGNTANGGSGGTGRAARARALELAQQLGSCLQHAVPPPPRPDFTTASAILRWLQQNNNSVPPPSINEQVLPPPQSATSSIQAPDDPLLGKRLKYKIEQQKRKIKRLNESVRRKKLKISSLENIIKKLQNQNLLTESEGTVLENIGIESHELLKRQIKTTKKGKLLKTKYSQPLRRFALTLNYYSPKAYSYVRRVYDTCLPHPSTLSKWYQCIEGNPGFTKEAFDALGLMAKNTNYPLVCSLMFDEMAIRRRVEWDGKKFHGYVDFGTEIPDEFYLAQAKDVLVILIVAINATFKVPVAYFLVDGVKGEQRANLVNICLTKCHESGIKVVSVTSDGCPANISAMKILGCSIQKEDIKVTFPHPVTSEPVYIFLDPPHMVKLVRNAFQSNGTFIDCDGKLIDWSFLEKLNDLQMQEYFHLANKLSPYHIHFQNNIMKVKFATQLFSNSVSEALSFCENDLHLPAFHDVSGTVHFLKVINDLFDVLNSRNVGQKFLKEPLNKNNYCSIVNVLNYAKKYLLHLKSTNGKFVVDTKRKVGFLGLIVCIESTKGLFEELVLKKELLIYLPTYKVSQDHLELLFSNFRSHGGPNNNPTAKQLKTIYKKILTHVELRETEGSNCIPLENINILNCSSVDKINKTSGVHDTDYTEDKIFTTNFNYSRAEWNEFSENIISYLAGYVVNCLISCLYCETCISALINENNNLYINFIIKKDKGGLTYPSQDVIEICRKSEFVLRKCLNESGGNSLKPIYTTQFIVSKILKDFIGKNLFEKLTAHQFDQTFPESNHSIDLAKAVMEKYITVRIHFITKRLSQRLTKRQLFNRLNLFSGQ